MILSIFTQLLYVLVIIFLFTFIVRFSYLLYKISKPKIKSFFGVMIEGSEIYWRWRWKKLHKEGTFVYDNLDIHHETRGWTLKPNLKNKLHYAAVINSNHEGIRGSKENHEDKKILFFGDSFCFGEGVDDDETISYFTEKKFSNTSVLNLGVHGYGIDQQYLYLKETISKYKPALTCFVITDNDFRRDFMDFRDAAKPKFILRNNELVLTNVPVPKPEELFSMKTPSISKLFFELIKNFLIFYGLSEKRKRKKLTGILLDKIKEETQKNNSQLIFIYITEPRRGLWYKLSYINRYFVKSFKKRAINYIYPEKIFKKKKFSKMFDTLSGHFTAEGNAIIAEEIVNLIKSKELLK